MPISTTVVILGLIILILLFLIYFLNLKNTKHEGFYNYPLTNRRIEYGNNSKKLYNPYADIVNNGAEAAIPLGKSGDNRLHDLFKTPSVEGDSSKGAMMGLNYYDESPYKNPPGVNTEDILSRVKYCESVTKWDCTKFEDIRFSTNCGICTSDGEDRLGNPHIGGLYIDPISKATNNVKGPSIGKCRGEFITNRPYCDVQKDRHDCSKGQSFDDPVVKQKCALCAFGQGPNKFVYTGSRADETKKYALSGNPVTFPVRLRLAVSDPTNAKVVVTSDVDQKAYNGTLIPTTNVYLIDIPQCVESQKFTVLVKYPDYLKYDFNQEEKIRISALKTPNYAQLKRAMFGPITSSWEQDDSTAVDVAPLLKRYGVAIDCSNPKTYVTDILFRSPLGPGDKTANFFPTANQTPPSSMDGPLAPDGRGIDPAPGIKKQLRLEFSDGKTTAYAYGSNNGLGMGVTNETTPVNTPSWVPLCGTKPLSNAEAERQVCELDLSGNKIPARQYTGGNNSAFYGVDDTNATCIIEANKVNRGIAGLWESKGPVSRVIPLDLCVKRINGLEVGPAGPPKLGTVSETTYFKNIISTALPGILPNLHWFWARDSTLTTCQFSIVMPATLRDPSVSEDNNLCPSGPLISLKENAALFNAGACEKLVNGEPQGPGNISDDCLKSLFISSGCRKEGKAYPSDADKSKALKMSSGYANNLSDITANVNNMYSMATEKKTIDGKSVSQSDSDKANMDCFGIVVTNPCDTPNKNTGPHTADCLDYLFRDAGKYNRNAGKTYQGLYNRTSGTEKSDKSPIMYCQRSGSLAPIDSKGKVNNDAISLANSYGSINAVKEFYRQVHYDANFNTNSTVQQIALGQCYGVGVKVPKPICRGIKARYIRVRPSQKSDNNIQISQIEAYNVLGVNVSKRKVATGSRTLAVSPDIAVDGESYPRPARQIYVSQPDKTEQKSVSYWEVDLGKTEEIAYVIYVNTSDITNTRSVGMRFQLVDENKAVVKQELAKGGLIETIPFSDAKPSNFIIEGSNVRLSPGMYAGSAITSVAGGETLIKPAEQNNPQIRTFTVSPGNFLETNAFSFKLKGTQMFLRVQGYRIRLTEDDGSAMFKKESTFIVSDSLASRPGEVSFKSLSAQASYLSVSDNMGIYVSQARDLNQKRACSWRVSRV